MLAVALIIVFVPLVLLSAIAMQRQVTIIQFVMSALALGLGLLFIWLALPWDVISIYYRMIIPILFLVAVVTGFRRIGTAKKEPPKWLGHVNLNINLLLVVFFAVLSWVALKGYPAAEGAIELASPLRGGSFVVRQGGASPFINIHAKVRPQNHAIDILGLNSFGASSNLFGDRKDLENYAIFGATIQAPCAGRVIAAVDGLADLAPGDRDRENLAGNHVVISCLGAELLLAHMMKESVAVAAGETVEAGAVLGRVGNSGNSTEPHLHIHAERGGEPGEILNGEAVPFTIDGRYLVRGNIIR